MANMTPCLVTYIVVTTIIIEVLLSLVTLVFYHGKILKRAYLRNIISEANYSTNCFAVKRL